MGLNIPILDDRYPAKIIKMIDEKLSILLPEESFDSDGIYLSSYFNETSEVGNIGVIGVINERDINNPILHLFIFQKIARKAERVLTIKPRYFKTGTWALIDTLINIKLSGLGFHVLNSQNDITVIDYSNSLTTVKHKFVNNINGWVEAPVISETTFINKFHDIFYRRSI